MKKYLVVIFLLLAFILIQTKVSFANNNRLAAEFGLKDLKGNTVELSSFKNKQSLLLVFWTTWCPFCQRELNELNSRLEAFSKEGVELLAINLGEQVYKVDNFVKANNINLKVLVSPDGAIADDYKVVGVPTYALVNKNGEIVFQDNSFPADYKKLL